ILLTADGKLAGIFTHGDYVRAYVANPLIGQQPVGGLMTRNPIYVMEDDLAAEAVKAVSNRHIDDLVVLNKDMAPVGIIDLQDLARMKLV
ncbi:CBS domain-containing protein, partial [Akkermansia sp.]|uniref:CBS domain-containing protein n=1 Tax=Akkermansia sp. TaxID=1872421 RepID=UPI0039965926